MNLKRVRKMHRALRRTTASSTFQQRLNSLVMKIKMRKKMVKVVASLRKIAMKIKRMKLT